MAFQDDEEEQPRSRRQAPYQQSRAALRKLYGSRTIGGPTRYSERDTTPSAREARAVAAGYTPTRAAAIAEEKFFSSFTKKPNIVEEQFNRRSFQSPMKNGWQLPISAIQGNISAGNTGVMNVPYGQVVLPDTPNPTSLLPAVGPIDQISDFMPTTTGPLSSFNLPRPSLLGRRPSFG